MQYRIYLCILTMAMSLSCQKDESVLQGCCGNEPVSGSFGNARILVPNIFTPNGDGVNDLLFIHGDSIRIIHTLEIINREGNPVVEMQSLSTDNPKTPVWDGMINGVVQTGLYTIYLSIEAEDGTVADFAGTVCNYPCALIESKVAISMDACYFSSQFPNPYYLGGGDTDPACFY